MSIARAGKDGRPRIRLTPRDDAAALQDRLSAFLSAMDLEPLRGYDGFKLVTIRDRCFLSVGVRVASEHAPGRSHAHLPHLAGFVPQFDLIRMIHVPGFRGNPERSYPRATLSTIEGAGFSTPMHFQLFPGTFERYVATVIAGWQSSGDGRMGLLEAMLRELGLGRELAAERLNDTQIELRVGPLLDTPSSDSYLVSIADVGFGVSQVLPVLVALLVADPGQLVYVEQPELHLHPRAQCALASMLTDAARRGVRLIVETHSALLLLSVRTLMVRSETGQRISPTWS